MKRLVKAGLITGAMACVGLLAYNIWRANAGVPAPPALPELSSVDLSLPRSAPPSRALGAFFRPRSEYEDREVQRLLPAVGGEAGRQIKTALAGAVSLTVSPSYKVTRHVEGHHSVLNDGRWLRDPDRVLTSLRGMRPPLAAFRAALHAKGCMPLPDYIRPESLFSHPYFVVAVKLDLIASVALIQRGEVRRGAAQIHRLARRLLELEQRCTVDMMTLLIIGSCLMQVQQSWAYLLAQPAAKAEHDGIWERMIRLESRPSRVANAWRRESVIGAGRIRRAAEQSSGIWFDPDTTVEIFKLLMKRRVWLAGQDLGSDAWTRPFAEDDYLERLESLQGFHWLRRNGEGLRYLSAMTRRGDQKYLLKVYQERCEVAARRALWMQELVSRGHPLSERALARTPVNPFTNRPFKALDARRPVCAAPERFKFSSGVRLAPLPGFPISAENSGPQRGGPR